MIIDYCDRDITECPIAFAYSQFDLLRKITIMERDNVNRTLELMKDNKDTLIIYFAQEFIEHDLGLYPIFELNTGYIFKIHIDDKFINDENERKNFSHAETRLTITSVKAGKEDKTITMIPVSQMFESFVGTTAPTVTLGCLFSGFITRVLNLKRAVTEQDYDEWLNDELDHTDYFYHEKYGITEEQVIFLFAFGDISLRPRLIHDISKVIKKEWNEEKELKYPNMLKGIIRAEIICGLSDYFLINSSFPKEILEFQATQFEKYDETYGKSYQKEFDFVNECLKHYKE